MKRFLLLLLVLITFNLYSQDKDRVVIVNELRPLLVNFFVESNKRGFENAEYVLSKVDTIGYFNPTLDPNLLGYVSKDYRNIYLSGYFYIHSESKYKQSRTTFYHEVGHLLTKSKIHSCHSCDDIMAGYTDGTNSYYLDELLWQKALDKYFEWLEVNKI